MQYKIVRVLNGVVSIASREGAFFNVSIEELDFDPKIGDEVQCFRNGEKVIVFKKGAPPRKQKQAPSPVPKNELPSNLQANARNSTVTKTDSQRIERKNPIENPFSEEQANKKTRAPWVIVGVILVVAVAIVYLIYGRTASSAENSKNGAVDNVASQSMEHLHPLNTEARTVARGTMSDSRDGKTYMTVKIGSQTWMAENLNYKTKNSYCYNNSQVSCGYYGRLYTWTAARTACPAGWHLPSMDEFEVLIKEVGGKQIAGQMLKSTSGWSSNGNGTDAFGFSALPAGYRDNLGYFEHGDNYVRFWSDTESNSKFANYVDVSFRYENVNLYYTEKINAFSIRCIQN